MKRDAYPSDLTDEQWARLEPFFPTVERADGRNGRPRAYSYRAILNGIFYILRAGCAWSMMPRDLPPHLTCYHYFRLWSKNGLWLKINDTLREQVRLQEGRQAQPTAGIVDSQSAKTTEKGGHPARTPSATTGTRRSRAANAMPWLTV